MYSLRAASRNWSTGGILRFVLLQTEESQAHHGALATLVGVSHVLYSTTHHEALVLLWVLVAAACAVRAAQRFPGRASRQARSCSR